MQPLSWRQPACHWHHLVGAAARCNPRSGRQSRSPATPMHGRFVRCLPCLPAASTGNGNSDHIGDKVALPPVIHLNDGVYEVGRTSPADIRIAVPTVSSRHALLRVGEGWGGGQGGPLRTAVLRPSCFLDPGRAGSAQRVFR